MTPELRASIAREARAWLGTPYHPHARVKGAGVDCAMLLAEVYEAAGATDRVDPGYYAVDWHLHRGSELYLAHVLRRGRAIDAGDARVGDLVVVQFGRTYSHGGIIVEGAGREMRVVHAYYGRGVIESFLHEEPLAGRAALFFGVNEVHATQGARAANEVSA